MKKYKAEWEEFARRLATGARPATFEDTWDYMPPHVCGLYRDEAQALWDNLQIIDPISIAEIGRNLGGGLFLMVCACPHLEFVKSWDIKRYPLTDDAFKVWFKAIGLRGVIDIQDSADAKPVEGWFDFVWIDGDHTGLGVLKDIMVWQDKVEWIGFHDYADKGSNKHRRCFKDVVAEITAARERYGWEMLAERGRSDVVFKVNS